MDRLGGLGVLEPWVQQYVLQLRWMTPLLSNVPNGPLAVFWSSRQIRESSVLPRLADYLLHHLQAVASSTPRSWPLDDYQLSFLFPDLRPTVIRSHHSPFYLLFKAVDILPSEYQSVVPNAATCLQWSDSGALSKSPVDPIRRSLTQLRLSISYVLEAPHQPSLYVYQFGDDCVSLSRSQISTSCSGKQNYPFFIPGSSFHSSSYNTSRTSPVYTRSI